MTSQLTRIEEKLFLLFGGLLIAGLFYSRFMSTLSLVLLCLMGLRYFRNERLKNLFLDRKLLPFCLVFFSVLISYVYSDDQEAIHTAIRVKLPFLFVPICFILLPGIRWNITSYLHYWLIASAVLVGMPVVMHALKYYPQMLELISRGQPIPTPIEHVKYSMINAYAAMSALVFLIINPDKLDRNGRIILGVCFIFLVFFLHILAVRTGLVIFYCSFLVLGVYLGLKQKSAKLISIFVGSLALILFISYLCIPSIRHKVGYMLYDWRESRVEYSDSKRMMSARYAWSLIKESPMLGVGFGDVKKEIGEKGREDGVMNLDILPHSQFLLTITGSGIIGLGMFVIGFYMPLVKSMRTSIVGILLGLLYLNFTLSFLVENSLERSVSVAFFVFIVSILLKSEDIIAISE